MTTDFNSPYPIEGIDTGVLEEFALVTPTDSMKTSWEKINRNFGVIGDVLRNLIGVMSEEVFTAVEGQKDFITTQKKYLKSSVVLVTVGGVLQNREFGYTYIMPNIVRLAQPVEAGTEIVVRTFSVVKAFGKVQFPDLEGPAGGVVIKAEEGYVIRKVKTIIEYPVLPEPGAEYEGVLGWCNGSLYTCREKNEEWVWEGFGTGLTDGVIPESIQDELNTKAQRQHQHMPVTQYSAGFMTPTMLIGLTKLLSSLIEDAQARGVGDVLQVFSDGSYGYGPIQLPPLKQVGEFVFGFFTFENNGELINLDGSLFVIPAGGTISCGASLNEDYPDKNKEFVGTYNDDRLYEYYSILHRRTTAALTPGLTTLVNDWNRGFPLTVPSLQSHPLLVHDKTPFNKSSIGYISADCLVYVGNIAGMNQYNKDLIHKIEVIEKCITESDLGVFQSLSEGGIPVGCRMYYDVPDGTDSPLGWLWLDGTEKPIESYNGLYELYGDRYGTASRPGYFKLPNAPKYIVKYRANSVLFDIKDETKTVLNELKDLIDEVKRQRSFVAEVTAVDDLAGTVSFRELDASGNMIGDEYTTVLV